MRSEALKLAQKKYHDKIKNDPIFIEKRKLAQKRYRQKNYERCLEINRNSNRNRYNQIDNIKEHKKEYYLANRNYRNLDTIGKSLNLLFAEC
tara:strand:- start:1938 stop:2213 length:276 start_codon:yes stop_codon:yes gene_type:complete